jgi:hypothetical protein
MAGSDHFWNILIRTQANQAEWQDAAIDYWSIRQKSDIPPSEQKNSQRALGRLMSMPASAVQSMISKKSNGSTGILDWYEKWSPKLGLGFAIAVPQVLAKAAEHNQHLASFIDDSIRTLQSMKLIKGGNGPWITEPALWSELEEVFPKSLEELRRDKVQDKVISLVNKPLKNQPDLNPYSIDDEYNGKSLYHEFANRVWMNTSVYGTREGYENILDEDSKSTRKVCFDPEYRKIEVRNAIAECMNTISGGSESDKLARFKKILFNLALAQDLIEDNYSQSF